MHLFRRADELDEDPLHGSLVGQMADLPAGHPGCLVAACYQDCFFDREVRDLYTSAMLGKRRRFRSYRDFVRAIFLGT
jgi:TetR/AcrR family transcriptional repressor of nem operon